AACSIWNGNRPPCRSSHQPPSPWHVSQTICSSSSPPRGRDIRRGEEGGCILSDARPRGSSGLRCRRNWALKNMLNPALILSLHIWPKAGGNAVGRHRYMLAREGFHAGPFAGARRISKTGSRV